jgi:MFS family permease
MVAWKRLELLIGFTGRLLGLVLGLTFLVIGMVLTVTVIGALLGIPLALFGPAADRRYRHPDRCRGECACASTMNRVAIQDQPAEMMSTGKHGMTGQRCGRANGLTGALLLGAATSALSGVLAWLNIPAGEPDAIGRDLPQARHGRMLAEHQGAQRD